MKRNNQSGITLIELILYTGILIVVLTVFYELFSLAGIQKLSEINEYELYSNGSYALSDIQREIQNASTVTEPLLSATSNTLNLDNGAVIIFAQDGRLKKTSGGITDNLTNSRVVVDNVSFTHYGPSDKSPTISIVLTLKSYKPVEGRVRTETFRSSASLR